MDPEQGGPLGFHQGGGLTPPSLPLTLLFELPLKPPFKPPSNPSPFNPPPFHFHFQFLPPPSSWRSPGGLPGVSRGGGGGGGVSRGSPGGSLGSPKGGARRVGPRRVGRVGAQNFAFFLPSPAGKFVRALQCARLGSRVVVRAPAAPESILPIG